MGSICTFAPAFKKGCNRHTLHGALGCGASSSYDVTFRRQITEHAQDISGFRVLNHDVRYQIYPFGRISATQEGKAR